MANFNKAFNFRGGFQVDTDVLIVRGQNVGIGSTIPSERLDVNGIIKANGLDIRSTESVNLESAIAGVLTVTDTLNVGVETTNPNAFEFPFGKPLVQITTGIITSANPALGVVTYYGDGAQLLNLPTSQWLDIDVGLGFTSIYAQGNVGVDTTDPRYVFQVGGVPFAPRAGFALTQTGVGIENGEIYASGIITCGSDVGVGGTIYADGSVITQTEFVGVGSQITFINADNIAIGSIGSMRYGDTIVTKEVYADRFIGTATSAEDLVPEATIDIDTARANRIIAVSRFISTEGNIVVGHDDLASNVGDIDVRKTDEDSTIYSTTSDTANARVFVGHEREFGTNNRYGGIRFGGNIPSSPQSGIEDFDIVNYSPGNLNFFLHDGSPDGGTVGSFRWINGQLETIVMNLTPSGRLELENIDPFDYSLQVTGLSTFSGDTFIGGELRTVGNSVFEGDLVVNGEISLGDVSFGSTITLANAIFTDNIIVGNDPSIGSGVLVDSSGNITITNNLTSGTNTFGPLGITINSGAINSPSATIQSLDTTTFQTDTLQATTITGNGFSVDNTGNVQCNDITANDLNLSGNLNVASINIPSSDIDTITATDITTTNLDVTGAANINTLDVGGALTVAGAFGASDIVANQVTASVITSSGGSVVFNSDVELNGTNLSGINSATVDSKLTVDGDLEVEGDTQLSNTVVDNLTVLGVLSTIGGAAVSTLDIGSNRLTFDVNEQDSELILKVQDANGNTLGDVRLPYS